MTTRIVPLTPDLWPDFEDLFGKQGACYGCWCTYFRMSPKARRDNNSQEKKAFIRRRIEAGPPPGLLALDGSRAVGWMQIGPRADVPEWNNHQRSSAPLDRAEIADDGVWAISCFFLRSTARGAGLTHRLVAAGIDLARENGARLLDACPMELSRDASSVGLFVGSKRVFDRAGFVEVNRKTNNRPLMRLSL
ncbi:GNAT family N-acetyltransferase [Arvimicrobium flavum]|uniref:GNAT family N-acetyltransferase n=1 Tax=Arvimicrobium flavum TaxID=3393320 RepID=UPI00237B6125|nr:GNAT family N-acetyltransferase [Mesorhizobium shangrilense]